MVEHAGTFVPQMREMARHMAWADSAVWSAVLASPQAESDSKIADTLHHIHQVQHIFVQAWTGAAVYRARAQRVFHARRYRGLGAGGTTWSAVVCRGRERRRTG